jgi:hypothetical protein
LRSRLRLRASLAEPWFRGGMVMQMRVEWSCCIRPFVRALVRICHGHFLGPDSPGMSR